MTHEVVPYAGEDPARVRAFAALVEEADGVEAFGEQTLLNLEAGRGTHLLVTGEDGLVGYAHIDRGTAELAAHPDHRRQGIGGTLLEEVKRRDPRAAVWAHGDLDGARALAASRGLAVVRELLYMTAPAHPGPLPPPPPGITLSTYTEADAADWLAVNAAAFADHPEQGRLTGEDLAERTSQPWFDPETFWLARDEEGDLAGYMWVKREAQTAEIYVVGVSPRHQGRGLGKFLTRHALAAMAGRGVREMDLYVEGDNHPALATYEAHGFTRAVTHVQYA